jgi:sugar (pentulose or hexulose) kinase
VGDDLIVVLDVGKTLAKLSLWTRQGQLVARESRQNARVDGGRYATLDVQGVETWMGEVLTRFAGQDRIGAIIPVGHGAAAAIVRDGALACSPIDYEEPIPAEVRRAYDAERDAFDQTGSPALPAGLNLGAQLYYLETLFPGLLAEGATILPWPQYWAWRLSGVAACELTSLGCHTDLWRPASGQPSALARRRGWADRLPPLTAAGQALGPLSGEWAARTGLPTTAQVYCGLHDSNAALLAARGFPEVAAAETTVLSTGTWFVAMRTPGEDQAIDLAELSEARDCLVNVDAFGQLVPSARFMGGREIETLTGLDTRRIDIKPDQPALLAAVPQVLASGARVLPTFATGVGPFPHHPGRWIAMPVDDAERRAAVALYAALVADTSLDLIGACGRILVEGRFAEAQVFVRALASLRPQDRIYVSNAENDVSYGALRLLEPDLAPASALVRVEPLEVSLKDYRESWARDVERMERGA